MLTIGGFFLQFALPANVTFAHRIASASAATVSSLMMGFVWGTGSLAAPIVGSIADRFGIEPTLPAMVVLRPWARCAPFPFRGTRLITQPARPKEVMQFLLGCNA